MRLSENFCLNEFLSGNTVKSLSSDLSYLDPKVIQNLTQLCFKCLQPARKKFGCIKITSGYRTYSENKLCGGVRNSSHLIGEAADIYSLYSNQFNVFLWLFSNVDFDQLIFYSSIVGSDFIHISFSRLNRHMVFFNSI